MTKRSLHFLTCLHIIKYWNIRGVTRCLWSSWFYFQWQVVTVMMTALPLNLVLMASVRVLASVDWMLFAKCCITKQYANVCKGTVEVLLQDARVKILHIQWNPVKNILKIPRKSYFLSGKFLKRVILMKWENFGAFLSWLLRLEIFLTGFFLSEFRCIITRLVTHWQTILWRTVVYVFWLLVLPYSCTCIFLFSSTYKKTFSCSRIICSYHCGLQSFSLGLCCWYIL
jgi:hypothetical protein